MASTALAALPARHELGDAEAVRLAELEARIAQHVEHFMVVAAALLEIQDHRLYRAEYGTFEAYCEARWDFTRQHAYRLIAAAKVQNVLTPAGVTLRGEAVARELVPLLKQPRVLVKVVKDVPGDQLTAAAVRSLVAARKPKGKPTRRGERDPKVVRIREAKRRAVNAAAELLAALADLRVRGIAVPRNLHDLHLRIKRLVPHPAAPRPRPRAVRGSGLVRRTAPELSETDLTNKYNVQVTSRPADSTTLRCNSCHATWTVAVPVYRLRAKDVRYSGPNPPKPGRGYRESRCGCGRVVAWLRPKAKPRRSTEGE